MYALKTTMFRSDGKGTDLSTVYRNTEAEAEAWIADIKADAVRDGIDITSDFGWTIGVHHLAMSFSYWIEEVE